MNEPSPNDLLGYILGALDHDQHAQMEQQIEQNSGLKKEIENLRLQVAPLDSLDPPGNAPVGLARRTCEFVANQQSVTKHLTAPTSSSKLASAHVAVADPTTDQSKKQWFRQRNEYGNSGRNPVMDLVMIAAALILLAAIVLPAVNHSRFQSRLLACQNNLRTTGMGLLEYSDNFNGKHLLIPQEGKLAFAGSYAPTLLEGGFVEDAGVFNCPGDGDSDIRIPDIDSILKAESGRLFEMQKAAGGDFSSNMGNFTNQRGVFDQVVNTGRSFFAILADKPAINRPGRASSNHGGYGQNVFFEDGHISYLKSPEVNDDAIYENDWGGIAPGAHIDDIVLFPSGTTLRNISVD